MLRFLFGIQVVEVAVEFVETVVSGQVFVKVPKVVLSKLARSITLSFQQLDYGRVL